MWKHEITLFGLTDKNLFSCCDNNPIIRGDKDGDFWHILGGAIVGAVCSAVSTYVSTGSLKQAAVSAAFGAATGALTAAFPGASVAINAVSSAAESVVADVCFSDEKKSASEVASRALVSAGTSALFSWVGGAGDDLTPEFRASRKAKKVLRSRNSTASAKKRATKSVKRYRAKSWSVFKKDIVTETAYAPMYGYINFITTETTGSIVKLHS